MLLNKLDNLRIAYCPIHARIYNRWCNVYNIDSKSTFAYPIDIFIMK